MPRLPALALVLGALTLTLPLAGCGSSSGGGSSTASTARSSTTPTSQSSTAGTQSSTTSPSTGATAHMAMLAANPGGELKYDTKRLTVNAGKVSIVFTNMSPLEHNVTLESSGGHVLGHTPTFHGGTKTLSLNLKPGVYKFFCSVPGHRQAGMEGELVVK